jgi:hypothetical protein
MFHRGKVESCATPEGGATLKKCKGSHNNLKLANYRRELGRRPTRQLGRGRVQTPKARERSMWQLRAGSSDIEVRIEVQSLPAKGSEEPAMLLCRCNITGGADTALLSPAASSPFLGHPVSVCSPRRRSLSLASTLAGIFIFRSLIILSQSG